MNKLFVTLATIAAFSTPAYSGTATEDLNMIFNTAVGQPVQVAELSSQEMIDTKGAYFGFMGYSSFYESQTDQFQMQLIQAQIQASLLKYLANR